MNDRAVVFSAQASNYAWLVTKYAESIMFKLDHNLSILFKPFI